MSDNRFVVPIVLDKKLVNLIFEGYGTDVDIDSLFKINHSNIYGEKVTIPTVIQKMSTFKALAEERYELAKYDCEQYAAGLKKRYRAEALLNQGKFECVDHTGRRDKIKLTEDSLKEAVIVDKTYSKLYRKQIEFKKDFENVAGLLRSAQAKNKQLENLVKSITPDELYQELIDGTINGILIDKKGNPLLKQR